MNINGELTHQEFFNRESMISHLSYEREMEFYQSIKMGNTEEAKRLFKPLGGEGFGRLCDDPLRNLKYHLIITVAFITRYCIEGGMEMETAYTLSDVYISRVDKCLSAESVNEIHRELVEDYAQRMHIIAKNDLYSKAVLTCMDYIYDNLHNKIRLDELAEAAGLSPAYLSKLFHREVGVTLSQYILRKRIEAAENLLKFSDYSCTAISNYLCFSSESYFICIFRRFTKITPKEYRKKFFRTRWGSSENKD